MISEIVKYVSELHPMYINISAALGLYYIFYVSDGFNYITSIVPRPVLYIVVSFVVFTILYMASTQNLEHAVVKEEYNENNNAVTETDENEMEQEQAEPEISQPINADISNKNSVPEEVNGIPCDMRPKLNKKDIYDHPVQPENHHLYEMSAEFGSDYTNLPEFFRQNPEMFTQEIHNPYVPNAVTWSEEGDCHQPLLDTATALIGQQTGLDKAAFLQ